MKTMTVQELDITMESLRAQIRTGSDELLTMTGDKTVTMEQIKQKKTEMDEMRERLATMEAEKAKMAANFAAKAEGKKETTMNKQEAVGMFYQAVLSGAPVPQMAYENLGAKPESETQGYGAKLVPTTLSNDILMEPQVKNPLREKMTITNITGLKIPKLGFSVADDSFVAADGESAKELAATGDTVDFGRYELALKATVSESLLRSTPLDVEGAVDAALQSAQAAKELGVLFNAAPTTELKHMSLYGNDIKEVTGTDLLDAVMAATADLEDAYQANACVVMRRQDYVAFLRTLAGSDALWGKKPEDVIGYPVIFCEKATTPVVGDFSYLHMNFEGDNYYDTDKDVDKRLRIFTLNAEYDIQIKMKSAFRLAKVSGT